MGKPFVIGIAGPTGSGKSTLANGIKQKLGGQAPIIHLDDYFIQPAAMPVYAGFPNGDDPRSIDYKRALSDFKTLVSASPGSPVVIVEGFLLFYFAAWRKVLDLRVYLNAPHEVTIRRRIHTDTDSYRSEVIKPMYEKYVRPSARYADVVFDVTAQPSDVILEKTLELLPMAKPYKNSG